MLIGEYPRASACTHPQGVQKARSDAFTPSEPEQPDLKSTQPHRPTRENAVCSGKSTAQCSRSPATFQDSELTTDDF